MKKIFTLLFVLLAFKSFAQHNLYTRDMGRTYTDENKVRLLCDGARKQVPSQYDVAAVIFHKDIRQDTIINYYNIGVTRREASEGAVSPSFKIKFEQDSAFLNLNKKLPFFKLKDIDGKVYTSNDFLGKPTIINFWNIYCASCVAEMPSLSKLKDKYKDKVNFISITDDSDAQGELHNFLKDKDFNFLVLQEGGTYTKSVGVRGLPRSFFVDKNGIVKEIREAYPKISISQPYYDLNHKGNFFVQILDSLIAQAK